MQEWIDSGDCMFPQMASLLYCLATEPVAKYPQEMSDCSTARLFAYKQECPKWISW